MIYFPIHLPTYEDMEYCKRTYIMSDEELIPYLVSWHNIENPFE